MKTVAIFGCGNLGTLIAGGLVDGTLQGYRLSGVHDLNPQQANRLAQAVGCPARGSLAELLADHPDYVVECTAPEVLRQNAETVLKAGASLVVLSAGAFADEAFTARAAQTARENGVVIHVASGAIGGFDMMRAARLMGGLRVTVRNQKPPQGLNGAPFLQGRVLDEDAAETLFAGSARQAIAVFPKNVNVAVAAALAAADVDSARVEVNSVPHLALNTHQIELSGEFGEATLTIASRPSRDNPKSSALAAYSVLALLEKLASPIQFA